MKKTFLPFLFAGVSFGTTIAFAQNLDNTNVAITENAENNIASVTSNLNNTSVRVRTLLDHASQIGNSSLSNQQIRNQVKNELQSILQEIHGIIGTLNQKTTGLSQNIGNMPVINSQSK